MNQTGWPHHWLDRYASSTAIANSGCRAPFSGRELVRSVRFLSCQDYPRDTRQFVGQRDGDNPEWLFRHERLDPVCHGSWLVLGVANDGRGADDEQPAQVTVSLLGDPAELCFSAGRMLLWRQPEPSGRLSTRPELVGIGDGGGDGCRGNDADARDRHASATGFAIGMPREELAIERRDLLGKRHELPNHGFQRGAGVGWQGILVRKRLLSQRRQIGDPGIGDETELRQMRAQSIGRAWCVGERTMIERDEP